MGRLFRILWVEDVKSVINYLQFLLASIVKNKEWLEEQAAYFKYKKENIICYVVRIVFNLQNSSNPVEKENDILVARWQKYVIFRNGIRMHLKAS